MVVCFVFFYLILCIMYSYYVYVFLLLCMFRSRYCVSLCCSVYCLCVRVGVRAPTKSVSVTAVISLLSPVQSRSGVHTHTDKIGIGACMAISFVSDAEQSTWFPCGIGGFICCVCFISGGDDV